MPIHHTTEDYVLKDTYDQFQNSTTNSIISIVSQISILPTLSGENNFTNNQKISYSSSIDLNSKKLIFETAQILCDDSNVFGDLGKLIDERIIFEKVGRGGGTLKITRERDRSDPITGEYENTIQTKSVPFFVGNDNVAGFEVGILPDGELNNLEHMSMHITEPRWSRISNPGSSIITNFSDDSGIDLTQHASGNVLTLERLLQNNEVVPRMKELVVEGGVHIVSNFDGISKSTNTFQTTFRNPITIHANKHYMSFHTGGATMEPYNPVQENSFTVNCQSDFNNSARLQGVPIYTNQFYKTSSNIVANVINSVSGSIIDNTSTFTKQYPLTTGQSLVAGKNYKIRIKQNGASSQNGISDMDLTANWTIPANSTSQTISVQESLPVSSSYSMSLHGSPELYYEIGSNGVWKLYLAFSHINGSYNNDSIPLDIIFRQENWDE